jgi:hypothetical protein
MRISRHVNLPNIEVPQPEPLHSYTKSRARGMFGSVQLASSPNRVEQQLKMFGSPLFGSASLI